MGVLFIDTGPMSVEDFYAFTDKRLPVDQLPLLLVRPKLILVRDWH